MSAILVVEQDPGYANRVVAALRAAGHEVKSAASRDEAESAASAGSFDLVLANGMMPGAADLLDRFSKARGGPGSVVLLPVTLASHTEASAYSADDILSKPFSDEDLDRVVSGRLSTTPGPTAAQPAAPTPATPSAPQPPTPESAPAVAPKPEAPKPAAPKRPSLKPKTVDSDIDDLLNKTLSGLDISTLTRKRPKQKPKPPSRPAAPTPAAPAPPAQKTTAQEATSAPPAATEPAAPEPPPQQASKPVSLTSTDIFGDVLAEVEAESEKSRASAESSAPEPVAPPGPAPPQPAPPQPATPSASAPPSRRSSFDDDLDRKLEETLSGILPSRLRRKPEEKPPQPAAPQPETEQPAAPRSAAPTQDFGAPAADAAPPEPTPEPPEPELPVDFSEDETVSIVRPVSEPRESTPTPTPAAPVADSGDDPEERDFFATTLLPTQSAPSTQVQPPADFVPPASVSPAETADSAPAAPEPAASQPTAPEPATPKPLLDSGDEFEISFGEAEPPKQDDDGNIWSAYGTEETAGWGTTSFEAQAPLAAQEPRPPAESADLEPPEPGPSAPEAAAADLGSDSVWEVPGFEEESTTFEVTAPADVTAPTPEPAPPEPMVTEPMGLENAAPEAAAEAPTPQAETDESPFQPPTFEEGPSLGEDPELSFESSDFAPADFAPEPDSPPTPPEPADFPAAAASAPFSATGSLDELSTELGADDSGSFHTALQGVLQIRGDDGDGGTADDQGIPFGDYRLLERVAVGGMAEVWRARRRGVEGFQKTVAIKRILSHLTGSTDFINMFIDEAKLAAQLNHANIAQIYDLGKVDDDFFIAMEYVEGRDLRTLLRESSQKGRPLPMGQALFIVAAVARALDYAHRKRDFEDRDLGLVHRDVSPQNVLVSTEGEIKLCDFGIVKAVAKASTTQMGALKGKLQYMSPEQAWGKEVDGRSDIFSLGTVMFEALTGEKLFTGDSEIGVLDAVRDCRIKSVRAIDPSLPESVEAILQKTLTATPEERYQTAGEMERDIQSVLETLKPSPGQSELARYMHGLLETPEPGQDPIDDTGPSEELPSGAIDEDGTAWTGTSWGTASFTEDEVDPSEPVSAKVPVVSSTGSVSEPQSSKPSEPRTSPPPAAMSSSKVPVPTSGTKAGGKKKGGGKLIWILLVITMLAIVGVAVWTQLGSGGSESDAPAAGSAPAATPADAQPTGGEPAVDGEATDGETPAEDPEAVMQQMLQEEMERKKKEMEEQFEAQKREIERRLKEVEGEDG